MTKKKLDELKAWNEGYDLARRQYLRIGWNEALQEAEEQSYCPHCFKIMKENHYCNNCKKSVSVSNEINTEALRKKK